MGRKVSKDPQEWMAYQGRLMALTLPDSYVAEVEKALPEKKVSRIKNARKGIVMDMEVLEELERLSNSEKGRRAGAAFAQPVAA
jgi:hypothetical protein